MNRLLDLLVPALMVAAPVALEMADPSASGDAIAPPFAMDSGEEPSGEPRATPGALSETSTAAQPAVATESGLSIYAIDVGQGDSTLVVGPDVDGHRVTLLMDAGDVRNFGRPVGGAAIVRTVLAQAGVTHLDYVIVSHYDSDHMGGFVTTQHDRDSLIWTTVGPTDETEICQPTSLFPGVAVLDTGPAGDERVAREQWERCLGQILPDFPGTEHVRVTGGAHIDRVIELGLGYRARIVAGGGHVIGTAGPIPHVNTENEESIALLISSPQGFDFLVTGDLIGQRHGDENARLEPALGLELQRRGVDVEVLRAGHHGAANASEADFLTRIAPEVAVISVGENGFDHPHCETYTALGTANTSLLLQTELGTPECEPPEGVRRVVANGSWHIRVTGDRYTVSSMGPSSPMTGAPTTAFTRQCTAAGCAETTAEPPAPPAPQCCRICTTSQPCGDGCIANNRTCHRPPGCACSAAGP